MVNGEGLSDLALGGDGTSPMVGKNLRTRSTSLNTHISFDTFLSNISSNLASLTPINSNPRRNSYSANFTSFTNPTSFTNVPTFTPTPFSPNISLSPLTPAPGAPGAPGVPGAPGTPTNGTTAISNNRKSRSKSLNTGSKVYVPVSPNLQSPISIPSIIPKSAIASPSLNSSDPNTYNSEYNTPTPTKGRTVSFSEEDENIIFPVIPVDDSMDVKPIRVRSVSFDSSINTLDSFDAEIADTTSPSDSPNDLSPRLLINSNVLSPTSVNSPANRLRSKSVGTTPPKSKASVKNPTNDLFLKQHRGSKIPNPSPSSPDSFTSADGDDDGSEVSSAVSPSGSVNGTLSMPNLHYKNDYHTLRLEELDEEITSSYPS
jgi:hypothetical protein